MRRLSFGTFARLVGFSQERGSTREKKIQAYAQQYQAK
jgi:hypothetical protein